MKKPRKLLRSNVGQMAVEMILIMVVLVALLGMIRDFLQENSAFQSLTQAPWQSLSGMITSGVWKKPDEAINYHPNLHKRHGTVTGERL